MTDFVGPVEPLRHLSRAPRIFFTERRPAGITFTERMTGWWSPVSAASVTPSLDRRAYEEACAGGQRDGRGVELVVTVVAEDLESMLADPKHAAGFSGTATLTGVRHHPIRMVVTGGCFRLFVPDRQDLVRRTMEYEAQLTDENGEFTWQFFGFKLIGPGGGPARQAFGAAWHDQTRLFVSMTRPTSSGVELVGIGILTVSLRDFGKQLTTLRATGTAGVAEAVDTLARFAQFYGAVVRDVYGGPFARSRYAPPNWWRRPRPRPAIPMKDRHDVQAGDGAVLGLTHYPGGSKGPVILAPGFGVRADSYAIDTVPNIVQFLGSAGYDVWLFDYRASPELDAADTPFTIDDIAAYDWPAAVDFVRRQTHADRVDVIAHCVGGLSFMMAALGGSIDGMVRSAVCSQVATHPVGSHLNELKAVSSLGTILEAIFGVKALPVTVHAKDTYRRPLLDRLLKFYPTEDPCDNPVCRRIRFVFGESYLHANLNRDTHDAIIEMFGNPVRARPAFASVRALRHLARMIAARRLLDEDGRDRYLRAEHARRLDFRLCLMTGAENRIFPPEGIERSWAWLNSVLGPDDIRARGWCVLNIPDYAHMDCFIGKDAARDVFPHLEAWLSGRIPSAGQAQPAGAGVPTPGR